MESPKVSVCIPTYNYGHYLSEAIESVLNQTHEDFELLVVDDASQDDTDRIVQGYVAKDSRVRYLRNQTNIGMVNNWNRCMREAKGKYIKYLFGDDVFSSPMLLEKMIEILDSDESVSLVGSSRLIIDENSKQVDIWSFYDSDVSKDGKEIINTCLLQLRNYIGEPTVVMFRKSQASRGFDSRYKQLVDLEMWFHLLEQGRYHYFKDSLSSFRIHSEQQTRKNEKVSASVDDTELLYVDYFDKPYIKLGWFFRKYLVYDYFYQIWKSYKKKKIITKQEAVERISRSLGLVRFISFYPVYKTYKPLMKLGRYLKGV